MENLNLTIKSSQFYMLKNGISYINKKMASDIDLSEFATMRVAKTMV